MVVSGGEEAGVDGWPDLWECTYRGLSRCLAQAMVFVRFAKVFILKEVKVDFFYTLTDLSFLFQVEVVHFS